MYEKWVNRYYCEGKKRHAREEKKFITHTNFFSIIFIDSPVRNFLVFFCSHSSRNMRTYNFFKCLFLASMAFTSAFAAMECWDGAKSSESGKVPNGGTFCANDRTWCQIESRYDVDDGELDHVRTVYGCSETADNDIKIKERNHCVEKGSDGSGRKVFTCYFKGKDSNGDEKFCRCDDFNEKYGYNSASKSKFTGILLIITMLIMPQL